MLKIENWVAYKLKARILILVLDFYMFLFSVYQNCDNWT